VHPALPEGQHELLARTRAAEDLKAGHTQVPNQNGRGRITGLLSRLPSCGIGIAEAPEVLLSHKVTLWLTGSLQAHSARNCRMEGG